MEIDIDRRTSNRRKDGTYPVILKLQHNGTVRISTGMSAGEDFNGRYPGKGTKVKLDNAKLDDIELRAKAEVNRMSASGEIKGMTGKAISDHLKAVLFGKDEKVRTDDLESAYVRFSETKTNSHTRELYLLTLKKIQDFQKHVRFSDIDISWLGRLDRHLARTGASVNYRSIIFRNLKSVFNFAIDEGITDRYPFRKFRIRSEETAHRNLTLGQIRMLSSMEVEACKEIYRDLFMLMFYLIGMNISDLLSLTPSDMRDGRIYYNRNKTDKLYSIKVEPEAMEIIDRYRGTDHLISVMDRYRNPKDFAHRMNENLRKIGAIHWEGRGKKKIDAMFPELTTYWARHTWATLAASLEIPIETIGLSMGHKVGSKVTNLYIRYNPEKIDKANRSVIDLLKRRFHSTVGTLSSALSSRHSS